MYSIYEDFIYAFWNFEKFMNCWILRHIRSEQSSAYQDNTHNTLVYYNPSFMKFIWNIHLIIIYS